MVITPIFKWESMTNFNFKSIPPCLQQWSPLIEEDSKNHCRMFVPPKIPLTNLTAKRALFNQIY